MKLLLLLLAAGALVACQGKINPEGEPTEISYDSLVFHPDITRRNTSRERIFRPKISPEQARGRFETDIAGLDLNETDGSINIDRSEAGIRYTVRFVPNDPKLKPDTVGVIIAGIDYLDSVYVLARNRFRAFPILNADRNYQATKGVAALPRSMTARFTANFGFTSNLPPLLNDSLGIIDLSRAKDIILERRRLNSSFTNPLNLTIRYTLRDSVKNTKNDTLAVSKTPFAVVQNTISVQIYHYQFRTDIPAFVADALRQRRAFPRGRTENTPQTERPVILVVVDRD
ncbi:MAG: hypothetical protein RMJ87_02215 [Cytophagales bacterium]|nr:hypothetical protein [Bernardetiaceae bacterium]MDW8203819.1 hypothetical protein [Cytophagales bacterium]